MQYKLLPALKNNIFNVYKGIYLQLRETTKRNTATPFIVESVWNNYGTRSVIPSFVVLRFYTYHRITVTSFNEP